MSALTSSQKRKLARAYRAIATIEIALVSIRRWFVGRPKAAA